MPKGIGLLVLAFDKGNVLVLLLYLLAKGLLLIFVVDDCLLVPTHSLLKDSFSCSDFSDGPWHELLEPVDLSSKRLAVAPFSNVECLVVNHLICLLLVQSEPAVYTTLFCDLAKLKSLDSFARRPVLAEHRSVA